MKKIVIISVILAVLIGVFTFSSFAAVGCTLNDPDRDVKRIFPQSTGYRTLFITLQEKGGEPLKAKIEDRLGDKFDSIYETIDVPYAFYIVLKGKDVIGRMHGVNQKGTYGGMQLILATDLDGKIIDFYYQKISSPEAAKFRDKSFTGKFIGLTLLDFYESHLDEIKDPTEKSAEDFRATLRGMKKNLILLDEFMLDNKYDRTNKEVKNEK